MAGIEVFSQKQFVQPVQIARISCGTGDRIRTNDTPGMKYQIWGQILGNYPII